MDDGDAALARELASTAGEYLLVVRDEVGFADPKLLRDTGDERSQRLLATALAASRPGDAILSEEAPDDLRRLAADRVWIVDPLDGTREFAEPGRTDWAVHVALWVAGELVTGAVALPALGVTLSSADDRRSGYPAPPGGRPRIVASRSRAPAVVDEVAHAIGGTVVPLGSAGAKVAAVVRGDAEAYVHAGGQYEWDSAAPVAVARAAGLHASRLDGSPLAYNQPDPLLPDLLVCRRELAPAILAVTSSG